MQTAGELWQSCMDVTRLSGADALKRIKRTVQKHYYNICEMTDWIGLRDNTELTFTTSETDGHYLPSDLIGVMDVADETDNAEQTYHRIEQRQRHQTYGRYSWFYPSIQIEPLLEEHKFDVAIDQGAVTFSPAVSSAYVGEYVQFVADDTDSELFPGIYLIDSTTTIATKYWGPKLVGKGYIVRPARTRKIVILDRAGDLDAATVTVRYWKFPPPLYQSGDIPRLPDTEALELMAWIDLVGPGQKQGREANQYTLRLHGRDGRSGKMAELLRKNPKSGPLTEPKNRVGRTVMFGRRRR